MDLGSKLVLKRLRWQLAEHEVCNGQEVLVYVAQQGAYLVQLGAVGSEDLGRAGEVVYDRDRQDLDAHLLFNFASSTLFFVCFEELSDRIIVFIGVFPPLRAKLAHVLECVFL